MFAQVVDVERRKDRTMKRRGRWYVGKESDTTGAKLLMTKRQSLLNELKTIYETADDKTSAVVLFAIEHATEIDRPITQFVKDADINETYDKEIGLGIKLAEHVTLK